MAENDNRQMRTYGDDERTGKARQRAPKVSGTAGVVPASYRVPAGKDVMLKDILYRIDNREFGKDIFEDKAWLERRLYELSCHKDKSSYQGTEYDWSKGRKVSLRVTKEQLVERVAGMLETVNNDIYNHTIPVIIVDEAIAYLQDEASTVKEKAEAKKNLEGVIKFMLQEEAPQEYYSNPTYDRKTGEFVRKRIKKEEILEVAMDLNVQLQTELAGKVATEDDTEPEV
ncbi:MAG: hypothetical protein IKC11_05850 [Clostridia bacterium]|nr:hypothetical protein [Clostridia bacterium]